MDASKPIRLAYLVSQYPTSTHTFVLREIRGLRSLGFDIDVISIRRPDRDPASLAPEELEEWKRTRFVLGAAAGAVIGAHLRTMLRHPLGWLRGLMQAMRMSGPDARRILPHLFYFAEAVVAGSMIESRGIAHLHTHFSSTVALLASRIFPITWSATIHGSAEFEDVAGFRLAEKVARSRFIVAISHFGASQLMWASGSEHWSKIHVARLGVDPAVFTPVTRSPEPRPFRVVCVGSLVPVKAHRLLLEAVEQVIAECGPGIVLTLVGNGPERGPLERTVEAKGLHDAVVFAGSCNQDRVIEYYNSSDAFAMASFAEGIPVVLMEAMATGLPCVAPWITGIPELIRHGVDGLLVTPASAGALAQALVRLMRDAPLRERLGRSARERVLADYNLGNNIPKLSDIFHIYLGVSEPGRPDR